MILLGRLRGALRYLLLGAALFDVALYLFVVFRRIGFPFELEWMEGGAVDHVLRILHGLPLYAKPSLTFVPYIYPPLYYYLSAAASLVLGEGFFPLRVISFAASIGAFAMVFMIVRRETANIFAGIIGAALFAATFPLSDGWFDIGRVDSLFIFLLLVAIYFIRFVPTRGGYIVAGIFIILSYLTKQTALGISFALMLYCALVDWRKSLWFIGTVGFLAVASFLILNHIYDGWYAYYLYKLPAGHALEWPILATFWVRDILPPLAVSILIAVLYLAIGDVESGRRRYFYPLLALGMVGWGLLSRMHIGGYVNVLIPVHAVIAILCGIAIPRLTEYFQREAPEKARGIEAFISIAFIVQFALLAYNPRKIIPAPGDVAAGGRMLDAMRSIRGDIFMEHHSYLPVLAGKNSNAQGQAILDILRGSDTASANALKSELADAITHKKFGAIILDNTSIFDDVTPGNNWLKGLLQNNYTLRDTLHYPSNEFWPVVGSKTRPEYIYVPVGLPAE
ncbi:MAG: glycosyltransferase family 39 protein [Candidatus Kapaibacterium sp.]